MNIGIPLEVMTGEGRVALTPEACGSLISAGHRVLAEKNAGLSSGYTDQDYSQKGVEIVGSAQQLYDASKLIVKVKQPLASDLACLRSEHIVFSYFHLAADIPLAGKLCDIGLSAIPFESVSDDSGALPLLTPMSQVAGRISVIRGASLLFRNRGGRGILLGGVDGSESGNVVVLGAGVAGSHAVAVAAALGAKIDVLDLNDTKLQQLKQLYPTIETHISTPETVESLCREADLVIGAVLLAGRRAPIVLKQSVVKQMPPGSVIIDIAIDQGGCVENIHATSSEDLSYVENGVIHSAVPNMPATVARTASQSLSSAILPYVEVLAGANLDIIAASSDSRLQAMHRGMAIFQGKIVDQVLLQEVEA